VSADAQQRRIGHPRILIAGAVALIVVAVFVYFALFAQADSGRSASGAGAGTSAGGPIPSSRPATSPPAAGTPSASRPTAVPAVPAGTAPSKPTVVCDTPSLAGPKRAPAGAVTVSTTQNLADVVEAHSAHTTYWLTPGTHRLGNGEYDQVGPQTGDTFIGAPGAVLDGRHRNLYAFGGDASGVTISHLIVQNFGAAGDNNNEGVVNHDSGSNWTMSAMTIQKNAGAGAMLGSGNRLLGSCLRNNGQYGFNAVSETGVKNIRLNGNEISGNNTDDWEKRDEGCGCTGGGKFWATTGATITNNYVHDNHGAGLWADTNNTGFLFQGNYISGNDDEGLMYEISYNAAILDNTFVRNAIVNGPTNPGFPTAALYLSESGSDRRVAGKYGSSFKISGNVFIDNWAGVIEWENADRFAGSPANSSTGETTLVDPSVATEAACGNGRSIARAPLLGDCRWKTQNVLVEHNTFSLDATKVPKCTADNGCGFNGVFSNFGTVPSWSPYKGDIVPNNITFHQNNVWRNNTYRGSWSFLAVTQDGVVSWAKWQAAPYHQDAGSTWQR
jgi:Right handed beta helix region